MSDDTVPSTTDTTALPPYLTVEDLAAHLAMTVQAVYSMTYRGQGPIRTRVGGRVRYARRDVERWLASNRQPPLCRKCGRKAESDL